MKLISKIKNFSLKIKLVLFVISFVIFSIITVSLVSFQKSNQALNELTENQLASSGMSIKQSLSWFLTRTENFTSILAEDRLVEGLLIAYESSFFGSNFDPGKDLEIDNKYYQKLDKVYGKRKLKILKEYELKDLLLVSQDAQVIFTANNNQASKFLGRNLLNGVFKNSALQKCYSSAMEVTGHELVFSGFNYSSITNNVDGFICGKKIAEFENQDEGIDKGDTIGVIITQIDTSLLNKMLTARTGMGETGQSYIVGDDFLLRSDFFVNQEVFNAINSMKNKIELKIESVKKALNDKSGLMNNINPNKEDVLAYYQPFVFMENRFAIITEKTTSEIFKSVKSTLIFIASICFGLLIVIIFVTIIMTNSILGPVISAKDFLEKLSNELKTSAQDLQKFSNSLKDGAEETSSSIHEIVATMHQINEMVSQNLVNLGQTNESSAEVTSSVNQGKNQTTDMMNSMVDISSNNDDMILTINDINENMVEFKDVIMNISEKTNLIHDIVSQTKLLSFNASVEAARAGELGKGFAVVAEEIGNLASASGAAAEEIGTIITESVSNVEKMVSDTKSKVDQVKASTKTKIDLGKEKAQSCENSLTLIMDQIKIMNSKVLEIDAASNEQAAGIEGVSTAMAVLSENSLQTTKFSSETLESATDILSKSEDLADIYQNLDDLVSGKES